MSNITILKAKLEYLKNRTFPSKAEIFSALDGAVWTIEAIEERLQKAEALLFQMNKNRGL